MRTLVGRGIGAFIVVGHEHSLVGIRSIFLLGTSLERDLRDPFLMRIPLYSVKCGEQVIS